MMRAAMVLGGAAALTLASGALGQNCIDVLWEDAFDSYTVGMPVVTEQSCFPVCPIGFSWQGWSGCAACGDSLVADAEALSDLNSVAILGNPGTGGGEADDLVFTYQDLNLADTGTYKFTAWSYVPESADTGGSAFIMLNSYPAAANPDWSFSITLDAAANEVQAFSGQTLPLVKGAWTEFRVIISLDDDLQTVLYGGDVLYTKSWSEGVGGGGAVAIAALDLYGGNAQFSTYFDDLSLCTIPPEGACCFRSDPCLDGVIRADCEAMTGKTFGDPGDFQGIGSACGSCPFYGDDGWVIDDLLVSEAAPFVWNGDTCNDFPGIPFNEDCDPFPVDCSECDLSDSQDQAWAFTIPWDGTWTFSTCGLADFDTQLFASAVGTCLADAGFDDDCERLGDNDSELAIDLDAGTVINITLEGFQVECGVYSLLVGAPCVAKNIGPDEEILGPCVDDDTDTENVGCNAVDPAPPTFSPIACGQTFSGTVGNFLFSGAGRRDLDWFDIELTETTTISMCASANFPEVIIFLADLDPDPDPCTNAGNILASDSTVSCINETGQRDSAFYSIEVGPGRYSPIISTAFGDPALPVALGGVPCGSAYEFTITCDGSVPPTCQDCTPTPDLDGDGCVAFNDINQILANWGGPGPGGDADCSGRVDFADINAILGAWGDGCDP